MKKIALLILFIPVLSMAQTGPGGVGQNNGSTSLKIWYRTDAGVMYSAGMQIDSLINTAGISALDIGEIGTRRPTLVAGAVNGYDEMSFSGGQRLRSDLTLTTTNFIVDQASSFVVCRADNTTQTSSVYSTAPLVTQRFSCHIPWDGTVYYDIGACCGTSARIQVPSLINLQNYSIWSYDALPTTGKSLYRNGGFLANTPNTSTYNAHANQRFNIGGNITGSSGFVGDITEIIIFNNKINTAQRIIIENYLAAKYGLSLATNDIYIQDNAGSGNYDHDVAGIGRVDASNIQNDSQGTGIVRVLNPTNLGDNEYLIWGHDNGTLRATELGDVPPGVEARLERVWRVSERNASGTAVDVGNTDMRWDLNGLDPVTASDLRLLIDTDNDGSFSDETPIAGATDLGGGIYGFSSVPGNASGIRNNRRFTLGTTNIIQTPLPIRLVSFNVTSEDERTVKLEWETVSELNNAFFTVERSLDGYNWETVKTIEGAGDSSSKLYYSTVDENPYSGLSFYRLKQTDIDGKSEYSSVRAVNLKTLESNRLKIYPNPTNNQVNIIGEKFQLDEIIIFNSAGQNVSSLTTITQPNEKTITIDLSSLSKGIYFIKTNTGSHKFYKH